MPMGSPKARSTVHPPGVIQLQLHVSQPLVLLVHRPHKHHAIAEHTAFQYAQGSGALLSAAFLQGQQVGEFSDHWGEVQCQKLPAGKAWPANITTCAVLGPASPPPRSRGGSGAAAPDVPA